MSKKYKGKPCVYCQERPSINQGDHVFARKFFLESERDNPIKVPSCDECNNDKSKIEDYLTSLLPFGGLHGDAKENLSSLVPPRINKNLKLKRELKAGMKYVWSKGENETPKRNLTIPINGERYTELFKYILKALSWYYWGVYIKKDTVVSATALTEFGEGMFHQNFLSLRGKNRLNEVIGNDTVKYTGVQAVDNDQITVWKFEIYNGLVVSNSIDEGFHKSTSIGAISGPPSVVNPFIEHFEKL